FDSNKSLALSNVDAATMTTLAFASYVLWFTESTNETPRALPVSESTSTSCAVEFVRSVRFPVSIAGEISPVGESNAAWMSQPPGRRPHAPRPKHLLRYLFFTPSVVTPARYGVTVRPIDARLLR